MLTIWIKILPLYSYNLLKNIIESHSYQISCLLSILYFINFCLYIKKNLNYKIDKIKLLFDKNKKN